MFARSNVWARRVPRLSPPYTLHIVYSHESAFMPAFLLTAPAVEPLTLAEAKEFLRLEHVDDDGLLASLIVGARGHVEAATRRALITQVWRHVADAWPDSGCIEVWPAPLRAVDAARVYRSDGATLAIDPDAFIADLARAPAVLAFTARALPAPERTKAGIEIDLRVGYGDAATDVPEPLRQAMRLLIAHWYENRGLVARSESVAALPETIRALIAPYRVLGL